MEIVAVIRRRSDAYGTVNCTYNTTGCSSLDKKVPNNNDYNDNEEEK